MSRRRRYLWGGALGLGVAFAILAIRFGASLGLTVALATPDAWSAWVLGSPAREDVTLAADRQALRADLYRPAKLRGALVLVHGLSRWGRRHPDLERLARLLAQRGQLVLVPEFGGLAAFRLSGRETEEIRAALRHLRTLSDRVGIAGFSFGAGPALLAAESLPDLRVAGSFGGYADLRNVIAYITTGVHTFAGRRYVYRQEEYNRWKLLALLVEFVESESDRGLLGAIAERKLANPSDAMESLEASLGDEGRSVLALVRNRREEAVAPLLLRLPARVHEALDRLSPLSAVGRLPGRVLIAHGVADDSIPFTESLRLAEVARAGQARVAIFQTFHHTGPEPFWRSLSHRGRDAWLLFRLVDDLLAVS